MHNQLIFVIMNIMCILHIITIFQIIYVSNDRRAQSKELDPVSVVAEAENRSKTQAYQTYSSDTTIAPLSMPSRRIMTGSMR